MTQIENVEYLRRSSKIFECLSAESSVCPPGNILRRITYMQYIFLEQTISYAALTRVPVDSPKVVYKYQYNVRYLVQKRASNERMVYVQT